MKLAEEKVRKSGSHWKDALDQGMKAQIPETSLADAGSLAQGSFQHTEELLHQVETYTNRDGNPIESVALNDTNVRHRQQFVDRHTFNVNTDEETRVRQEYGIDVRQKEENRTTTLHSGATVDTTVDTSHVFSQYKREWKNDDNDGVEERQAPYQTVQCSVHTQGGLLVDQVSNELLITDGSGKQVKHVSSTSRQVNVATRQGLTVMGVKFARLFVRGAGGQGFLVTTAQFATAVVEKFVLGYGGLLAVGAYQVQQIPMCIGILGGTAGLQYMFKAFRAETRSRGKNIPRRSHDLYFSISQALVGVSGAVLMIRSAPPALLIGALVAQFGGNCLREMSPTYLAKHGAENRTRRLLTASLDVVLRLTRGSSLPTMDGLP